MKLCPAVTGTMTFLNMSECTKMCHIEITNTKNFLWMAHSSPYSTFSASNFEPHYILKSCMMAHTDTWRF